MVPGLGAITPVLLFDDDDFSAQVDANVRPIFLFLKYAGRAMVRAGGGSFVAISSTAAVFSTKYLASYAAGKAAVDQLVRVAANELGELGVRVNSVQPGMTRTPGTERAFANPKMMAAFLAAFDEACDIIAKDKKGAAQDFIASLKTKISPEEALEMVADPDTTFSATPKGIMDFANFMSDTGSMKIRPEKWSDMFMPALAGRPGS